MEISGIAGGERYLPQRKREAKLVIEMCKKSSKISSLCRVLRGVLLLSVTVAALSGQTAVAEASQVSAPMPGQAVPAPSVRPAPRITGVKGEYVGQTECRSCHKHDKIWDGFYKNPHFKSVVSGKEPAERVGCESCHGPGKAHVDAGGDIDTVVHAFSVMKPKEINAVCLTCHANEFNRANIRRSEHTEHDVACTSCHSIHNAATPKFLLAKNEPDACYQCHADVRAQFNLPSKHRVNEGLMGCTDCHNPHGGFTPTFGMGQTSKMLAQAHNNEQPCLKCHVDKRGPFVFEHQTGQVDGCISCHRPHGSPNAKLLMRPTVAQVCLECHTGNGDFGVRSARGITYPDHATHSMIDPHYQRCTACHVTIHGSNVHYRFLR